MSENKYLDKHGFSTTADWLKNALNKKSNTSHTHTKNQITDFPSSLPANGGNASTVNGHSVNSDVPANAKFTDTNTWTAFKGATANAAGTAGYIPAPAAGDQNKLFRADGSWIVPNWSDLTGKPSSFTPSAHTHDDRYYTESEIDTKLNGKANSNHTHSNYLTGITSKLVTDALGYTPSKTDTNTWRGIQNNLTSDSTSDSLSAAQGKALKALIDGKADSSHTHAWSAITGRPSTFAPSSHTHKKSEISDFPTSFPASDVYSWAKASSKPSYAWSEITGKPSTFSPSSHTHDDRYYTESEMNTKLSGKLNMSTASGIASCLGSGKYSYCKIASVKISASYINSPIVFELSGRGRHLSELTVIFANTSSTDPSVSEFITNYDNCYYIKKTATSTWEVYGQYSETYGSLCIHRITGTGAEIGVTVNMTNIDALPSGCTQATYGGNVGYANVATLANAVAWGNVSGKPSTYAPSSHSHSYNDLTNKPSIPSVGNGTVTITQNGTTKGTITMNQSGNTTVALSDTNTTYNDATTSAHGLMTAAMVTKLNGIAAGATAVTDSTVSGWGYKKTDNNTWIAFKGATTSAAGTAGYAPAPSAGAANRYLRSDGTWSVPPDTNTNTWRGIQNNLTSDSTSDSLSAAQGKALKALIDGKADSSHTHSNYVTNNAASTVSAAITFGKSDSYGIFTSTNNYCNIGSSSAYFYQGYINQMNSSILGIEKIIGKGRCGGTSSYPHLKWTQYSNWFNLSPVCPVTGVNGDLGENTNRLNAVYAKNLFSDSGSVSTSDRNLKHDINDITDEQCESIVNGLQPKSFKFNNGQSGRTHYGIIAQDLEELLNTLGMNPDEFAPLIKVWPYNIVEKEVTTKDDEGNDVTTIEKEMVEDRTQTPTYHLRYEEFIMILVKYCQSLNTRISKLENK